MASVTLSAAVGVFAVTIDESAAMATAQTDVRAQRAAFWITGVSVFVFWNLGTLVGALAGSAIDPQSFGLDAAFPAAGVGVAAIAAWRRAPLIVVIVLGAAVTAVVRRVS